MDALPLGRTFPIWGPEESCVEPCDARTGAYEGDVYFVPVPYHDCLWWICAKYKTCCGETDFDGTENPSQAGCHEFDFLVGQAYVWFNSETNRVEFWAEWFWYLVTQGSLGSPGCGVIVDPQNFIRDMVIYTAVVQDLNDPEAEVQDVCGPMTLTREPLAGLDNDIGEYSNSPYVLAWPETLTFSRAAIPDGCLTNIPSCCETYDRPCGGKAVVSDGTSFVQVALRGDCEEADGRPATGYLIGTLKKQPWCLCADDLTILITCRLDPGSGENRYQLSVTGAGPNAVWYVNDGLTCDPFTLLFTGVELPCGAIVTVEVDDIPIPTGESDIWDEVLTVSGTSSGGTTWPYSDANFPASVERPHGVTEPFYFEGDLYVLPTFSDSEGICTNQYLLTIKCGTNGMGEVVPMLYVEDVSSGAIVAYEPEPGFTGDPVYIEYKNVVLINACEDDGAMWDLTVTE